MHEKLILVEFIKVSNNDTLQIFLVMYCFTLINKVSWNLLLC